jgi:S1-C subfamily serine protease
MMAIRNGMLVAIVTVLVTLTACETTTHTFTRAASMAERSCAKGGKRPVFTKSEVSTNFWNGETVGLHAYCVGQDDSRYTHPGLQIMMNDSVDPKGARVALVIAGYAGEKAGLQANDLIIAIDDHPVAGREDVARYTGRVTTQTDVQIHVVRGRETLSLTARL